MNGTPVTGAWFATLLAGGAVRRRRSPRFSPLALAAVLAGCQAAGLREAASPEGTWSGITECHPELRSRYAEWEVTVSVAADGQASGIAKHLLASSQPSHSFGGSVVGRTLNARFSSGGGTVHQVEVTFPPQGGRATGRFGASTWCPLALERE